MGTNVVRDLLALDADVEALLPVDSSSDGFDNRAVSNGSGRLLRLNPKTRELLEYLMPVYYDVRKVVLDPSTTQNYMAAEQEHCSSIEFRSWNSKRGVLCRC